ncbi:aminopeptidase N [Alteromonas sp. ASW11-130]|uniref:aminopeptidase N n=1 Tax=Alteromonas sp. ASW11-130 TaxID=3015775 RepID=UPI002241C9BD|nr:aminopeptidase N [Alteromonas sp. ASW11-130]MCW8092294.1 aminopeptidase N [Alteromonas sp. ASW11-130]
MSIQVKRRADYRPPAFLVTNVELTIHLHPESTRVHSVLKLKRNGSHQEDLVLNGEHLNLVELSIDGKTNCDYEVTDSSLIIPGVGNEFTVSTLCTIAPEANKALEGLYLSNGVYCTQCEAEGFRRITYFLDRPDVLAKYRVTVHGDSASLPTLLSNGNPIDKGQNEDGTHWVTWEDPHPKPSYLFALVAGDFDLLEDSFVTASGKQVALELYVDKGKRDRGQFALDSLKRAMKWEEEVYGLEYDLDIYMVVAVDFFNMGAMENKGLNVFNSKFVLANPETATDEDFFNVESVIAHEYFHNWTGNRVTCRDWFQLSLKEGLTVFRDQQFSADMTSELSNRIKHVKVMREHQFAEDASAMSHPIRPDEVIEMNNFYTVTVYDKGAEVIRMMHTLLGEDRFRAGMDEYFKRYDGQAVTCDDFVYAMQSVTDLDLTHFAKWYSQSGTPEITVSRKQKGDKTLITVSQYTPPTADQKEKTELFIPLGFSCIDSDGNHYQDDSGTVSHGMLLLDKKNVTLSFENNGKELLPILLAKFSAPVRIKQSLSSTELLSTFLYAPDQFNRWDALQQLYDWCVSQYEANRIIDESMWDGLKAALASEKTNYELLSECLVIPSFETLCQTRTNIHVGNLYAARQNFAKDFVNNLQNELHEIYESIQLRDYQYQQQDVIARRCKNVLLNHLAKLEQNAELVNNHFHHSDNMTNTLGALKAAQQTSSALFHKLMDTFGERWKNDPLVLDKWFSLHATTDRADILSHLTMLQSHPQFSIENPNRVRSLIGSFAFYNTSGFHALDGSGYRFLTDYLLKLDASNPQVAARLVTPLTQWQRFDIHHQDKMKMQLARLLEHDGLSRDVYEKVSKSLAYESKVN